jgi:hypothetical protein
LIEALPWLLLASALRVAAWYRPNAAGFVLMVLADGILVLAFILVAQKTIELALGSTKIARPSFGSQVALCLAVLVRVVPLLVGIGLTLGAVGLPHLRPHPMLAFDGIAFDQGSHIGMVWSSVVACLLLLMIAKTDPGDGPELFASIGDLGRRATWLVPAILAVAVMQFALSYIQGAAREIVAAYLGNAHAPSAMKVGVFYVFVVGFASVRLCLTVALLTAGLRASGGLISPLRLNDGPLTGELTVMRFEGRKWPQIALTVLLVSIALGCMWVEYQFLIHDMLGRGRLQWLNDYPGFVRAIFFLPPTLAAAGMARWWIKTRVLRPHYVELSTEALTVSYQNDGKPISWGDIRKIRSGSSATVITASAIDQPHLDGREVRIATNLLKGSRKDFENALTRYWSRYGKVS